MSIPDINSVFEVTVDTLSVIMNDCLVSLPKGKRFKIFNICTIGELETAFVTTYDGLQFAIPIKRLMENAVQLPLRRFEVIHTPIEEISTRIMFAVSKEDALKEFEDQYGEEYQVLSVEHKGD